MSITYEPLTMSGRCFNGSQRDSGTLYHAVAIGGHGWSKAICGATPGKRGNGWSSTIVKDRPAPVVTCPRCLKKLETITEPGATS